MTARDKVLEDFDENPEVRVMIASLQCGGVGLNLTAAQKVIVVDPWFNDGAEHQAFSRVYRIGQTEETSLIKFLVKDTYDERLLKLKEEKSKEIGRVLDDREVLSKLSSYDLMSLFGEVRRDSNDRPFIYCEDLPLIKDLPKPNLGIDGSNSASVN